MVIELPQTRSLRLALPAVLLITAVLPAQTLQGSHERALNEALQPSEAEITKRVTPVVRAVRATADSVFSVLLLAADRRAPIGQGSGVILDEKGLAITNWHVVALATQRENRISVRVKLRNNKSYTAEVISVSPEDDLALLQLKLARGDKVQPITMGDSNSLMIGETMIAIGNPKGHQNTVTVGVLSATQRSINVRTPDGRRRNYKGLLQTDAAINQGNSGGALLDITGRLIGINSAVSLDSENIGFAIPVNTVRRVFHEVLLSSENITAVYLGMQVRKIGDRVVLSRVSPNGPAYRSGLRDGDQLVRVNGNPVKSPFDYARSLIGIETDRPLPILVRRGNREITGRPTPMSNAARTIVRRVGMEFEVVTIQQDQKLVEKANQELSRELNRPARTRPAFLRVTRVADGSPAKNLGIRKGDILLGIVDRVPERFRTSNILRTFVSIEELNDSLHVLASRYRDPEYTVWLLRDGEVLDGPLDVPRL
jgi:S1-C subfamily serine protease